MKKKYNIRKIRSKRSYSTQDIADTLGVHIQTVRDWKRDGLKPLQNSISQYLFMGDDIKDYLRNKCQKFRIKLKKGEFYCLSCRKAVTPKSFNVVDRNVVIGKGKRSLILKANCPECNTKVNRFSSNAEQEREQKRKPHKSKHQAQRSIQNENISIFDHMEPKGIN